MEHIMNTGAAPAAPPGVGGSPNEAARRGRIRALNDALRCSGEGGRVVVSAGVAALSRMAAATVLQAVANFTAFDTGNDPHDENDFGAVVFDSMTVFWKIDAYDLDLDGASPDPADPAVTARVLTVMLAEEY